MPEVTVAHSTRASTLRAGGLIAAAVIVITAFAWAGAAGAHELRVFQDQGRTRYMLDGDKAKPKPRGPKLRQIADSPSNLEDAYDGLAGIDPPCADVNDTTTKRFVNIYAYGADVYFSGSIPPLDHAEIVQSTRLFTHKLRYYTGFKPRFECVGGGLAVWPIRIDTCHYNNNDCDLARIVHEIRAKTGLHDARKFQVWYDGVIPGYCGQSEIWPDNRHDPAVNQNVTEPAVVSAVYKTPTYDPTPPNEGWRTCWQTATNMHEALHSIGAVQYGAPYSTAAFHCWDGVDIMCWNDGSAWGDHYTDAFCPNEVAVDCNRNTYIDPLPTPGSYLANFWNLADSPWLLWG